LQEVPENAAAVLVATHAGAPDSVVITLQEVPEKASANPEETFAEVSGEVQAAFQEVPVEGAGSLDVTDAETADIGSVVALREVLQEAPCCSEAIVAEDLHAAPVSLQRDETAGNTDVTVTKALVTATGASQEAKAQAAGNAEVLFAKASDAAPVWEEVVAQAQDASLTGLQEVPPTER